MRIGFVCIIVFLIISCGEHNKKNYLQEQEIALVSPRISVTNTIIDTTVVINADLAIKGVEIFFTRDGTEPTKASSRYSKPIVAKEAGSYKFKAFHPDWKPSNITALTLYKKGMIPDKMKWHTQAHTKYPDEESQSLVNQKKGSLNFRDTEWAGFDSIAKATVYFKKKTYLSGLTIGFLVDTKSWIFPPQEFLLYPNGRDPISVSSFDLKLDTKSIESVEIPIGQKLTSLTIEIKNLQKLPDWHPGKGNKAWLFLDEFIFNK